MQDMAERTGRSNSELIGFTEADINLKIALKLQNLLEEANATVILTRSDENSIHEIDCNTLREKKVSDIRNRVKIGNNSCADIFISIHLNKIPEEQYDGFQTFYNKKSVEGKLLAETIQTSLLNSTRKR
jgi:N-acetylmuramoyl-L-alanine amidase